jgi:methylglutamate dehydrogenase subunit D
VADLTLRAARPSAVPMPGLFGKRTGEPGVRAELCWTHSSVLIQPFAGKADECARRLSGAVGLSLPTAGSVSGPGGVEISWWSHNSWMALGADPALAQILATLLDADASIIDQSDARIHFRISGTDATRTLEKGVTIDLHPRVFRPGAAAATLLAHIAVHVRKIDDTPVYAVYVSRAFAADLWHWLEASAAEFGLALLPDRA